jgi:hypothetical protein
MPIRLPPDETGLLTWVPLAVHPGEIDPSPSIVLCVDRISKIASILPSNVETAHIVRDHGKEDLIPWGAAYGKTIRWPPFPCAAVGHDVLGEDIDGAVVEAAEHGADVDPSKVRPGDQCPSSTVRHYRCSGVGV